ncbi:MAG: A24 family peptidase C-terminal domain-containing protein [Thermoplasmata archaeon]
MILFLARLLLGTSLLAYAALRDWKTREVDNRPWALMGGIGLLLFTLEIFHGSQDPRTYLILAPIALIFADAVWDRDEASRGRFLTGLLYAASAATVILLVVYFPSFGPQGQGLLRRGFGALVVILLAYLFYYLGLLKGGADAKAFMSIGLLTPGYPSSGPFPLIPLDPGVLEAFELFFPFALSTLMNSALLLSALPLYFLMKNLLRGDFRWPQAFLGYRADLDSLPRFAWVLQEADQGGVRYHVFPRKGSDEANLEGLRQLGMERVWVTPQIPFLVPMTIGYVITFIVGNLLFALL